MKLFKKKRIKDTVFTVSRKTSIISFFFPTLLFILLFLEYALYFSLSLFTLHRLLRICILFCSGEVCLMTHLVVLLFAQYCHIESIFIEIGIFFLKK